MGKNRRPVAEPGGPYQGVVGKPLAFDFSGSHDPDNPDDQVVKCRLIPGDSGDLASPNLQPSYTYGRAGDFTARLTVFDKFNAQSDAKQFQVAISLGEGPGPIPPEPTVNQPPLVNAGADQTVTLPAGASLTGTITDDGLPEGATLEKTWTQVSGPATATMTPTPVGLDVRLPTHGAYQFRLSASDSEKSSYDDVVVTALPPVVVPPDPGGKRLLTADDFRYVGCYDVQTNGNDSSYSQGLTHRYVNGELRFLTLDHWGKLREYTFAGVPMGGMINSYKREWTNIGGLNNFTALWWDEEKQRLWTTACVDYTVEHVPTQIFTRTLNNDGTVGNLRNMSLAGINAKRVYGGVTKIPAAFQQQHGVGPYAVGFGGYTSLMMQGGKCAVGPTLYAIPDPASVASGSTISNFKTILDYAADQAEHRGARVTIPINYYDSGDIRQNPSTPPTVPPLSTAGWLSPRADGKGWMVWGDSYYNTGNWIDTPTRYGFVGVASGGGGKCWYQSSTLAFDFRQYEVHVFDPTKLGEVLTGQKMPWQVEPSSMKELNLSGMGLGFNQQGGQMGNGCLFNAGGATYDPITNRLYVMGFAATKISNYINRLYVFDVA